MAFTGYSHCAYMSFMALPALQEALEHLSTETRKHSETLARPDDVVSFEMAEVIAIADEAVRHFDALGRPFIETSRSLIEALENPAELNPVDLDAYAEILTRMKRSLREFARPLFVDLKANDSLAESLRSRQLPHPADRELAHRQAKRIDESEKACEAQRTRFLALTEQVLALMEANVAGNGSFDRALKKAIGRQSVERYPVINEYLAK